MTSTALTAEANRGSFAGFDARATMGEELTVVFFGASLTWGANATNQALPPLTRGRKKSH
jgi:hypothetical protein